MLKNETFISSIQRDIINLLSLFIFFVLCSLSLVSYNRLLMGK